MPQTRKDEKPAKRKRPDWLPRRGLVYWVSAEWILGLWPNGGGAIFARSIQISLSFYGIAASFHSFAASGWSHHFSWVQAGNDIAETLPWLGAIFAATYAALYARFSAQWSYLAGVYNQMMATQAVIDEPNGNEKIQLWKAGFAEDAEDLHLATKRTFATAVKTVLEDVDVATKFDEYTKGGRARRLKLLATVHKALE